MVKLLSVYGHRLQNLPGQVVEYFYANTWRKDSTSGSSSITKASAKIFPAQRRCGAFQGRQVQAFSLVKIRLLYRKVSHILELILFARLNKNYFKRKRVLSHRHEPVDSGRQIFPINRIMLLFFDPVI